MAIGFSSTMGTRRRMNMESARRSREQEEETAWDKMAKEVRGESDSAPSSRDWWTMAHEVRKATPPSQETAPKPKKWEELTDREKKVSTSYGLYEFATEHRVLDDYWDNSIISNAPLGESEGYRAKEERIVFEMQTRWEYGGGYKDIKRLRRIAAKHPEAKEKAEAFIERIKEIDSANGLSPFERLRLKINNKDKK